MGCNPEKIKPPKFIVVYRDSLDEEPLVEDYDYTCIAKPNKALNQMSGLAESVGAFMAIYELRAARYVSKSVLDLGGASHKNIST